MGAARVLHRTLACVATLGAVAFGSSWSVHAAVPAGAEGATPEAMLAEVYAPVVAVREQVEPCGDGEPFQPIAVDALWGRDEIVLRGPGGVTITGPEPDDLAGKGEGWYLDLPGNALKPECSYERFVDTLDATATVYARVLPDGGGGLALQYWFFYVYNDWNDRHEGDWEMIQLLFDTDDPVAALDLGPTTLAYAQHEGAELADWAGDTVELVDASHPVVYPGEGSHAAYYRADEWFGKSAQSGFGCDDTSGPHLELRPAVVLLDDAALPAWLDFSGRWGEQRPSFNNGPTGPNTKNQWREPRRWVDDDGRTGAVALPAGGSVVTDAFCGLTERASEVMFRALDQPLVVASAAVLLVLFVAVLVRRTRWTPVVVPPSTEPVAGGQIVRSAWHVLRRQPLRFLQLGVIVPMAGAVAALVQAVLFRITGVGALEGVLGRESVFGGLLAAAIGLAVITPAAATAAVASMEAARHPEYARPRVRELVADTLLRRRAIGAQLVTVAVVAIGFVSVVLLPVTVWWQARFAVAVPAAIDTRRPWDTSARPTRGHRVRALGITWTAAAIGVAVPIALGLGVLLLSDASFTFVNLIAGVTGLLTVPLSAVVTQLQYDDLRARETADPSTVAIDG